MGLGIVNARKLRIKGITGSRRSAPIRAKRSLAGLGLVLLMVASCSSPPSPTPTPTPKPTAISSPKGTPQPLAGFLPDAGTVDALINEPFTFQVSFQNSATSPGYGPFIDIAMNSRGVSNFATGGPNGSLGGPCDGITFTSAQMVDVTPSLPVTNTQAVSPCNTTSTLGVSVPHPYGSPVTLPAAGWQLNTLTLPFGSFEGVPQPQPTVVVEVTAFVSELANINEPLQVCIRGGFQGSDEYLNNVTTQFSDTVYNNWQCKNINPVVFTVKKDYLGPEDEAASGPNLSSFGMAGYQLTVNIANNQQINGLLIQDDLPNSLQYVAGQSPVVLQPAGWTIITSPCGSVPTNQISLSAPPAGPGDSIKFLLCAPLTGTLADNDVQLKFLTFVPQPVLKDDCVPVPVENKVTAQGKWQPLDHRDWVNNSGWQLVGITPPVSASLVITAKCLAVQKSVVDRTHPGATVPGDLLEYTITFQISDYFTIGQLRVTDWLADGQSFVASQVPTLTVGDGTLPMSLSAPFSIHVMVKPDETSPCKAGPPGHEQTVVGATVLTFDVSQAMGSMYPPTSRLGQGILTGGLASSPASTTPATGTITFYAQVDDQFVYPHLGLDATTTDDRSVNKLDPINNCVSMTGAVYTNQSPNTVTNLSTTGVVATDTSVTQLIIASGQFTKSIVDQNGSPNIATYNGLPTFAADDTITFELKYDSVPSSDAQRLTITDWLPLPVLDVSGNGPYSWPSTTSMTTCGSTPPAAGQACYVSLAGLTVFTPPTVSKNVNNNSLTFDFGTFHNLSNPSSQIIVRFTMKLTNKPYADLLHLTNVARECEGNAILPSTTQFCQVAVAPFILSEPALRIRKGVIKASPPTAVFDPAPPLPATFPPTIGQPVTGVNLNDFFNSNVTGGADAGDSLTFAIVVENYGSGLHGAFDVEVTDALPPGLTYNLGSIIVTYGDGTSITPTYPNGPPTQSGFDLKLPNKSLTQGALDADANASGPSSDPQSLAIITFQAVLADTIKPTCNPGLTNVAQIAYYAADAGGPNFVPYFGGPFSDTAWVCIAPTLTKSIVTTSEPSTPVGDPTPLTIGEIVRYRLQISLPEANYPGFTITDQLPTGLNYLADATTKLAFVSKLPQNISSTKITPLGVATIDGDETSIASIVPVYPFPTNEISGGPFGCSPPGTPGADPTFDLGDVVNLSNNPGVEFIVLEFNAMVCNITDNQDPGTRDNTFEVKVAGANPPTYSSNPVQATIVEPKLTVTKEAMSGVTSTSVGDQLEYKITLTNIGNATAFEVRLSDTYPLTGASITAVPDDGCSVQGTQVFCNYIPANNSANNSSVTITYWITVTADHVKIPDCTTTNTGMVTWTSLPGEGSPVSTLPKHNLTGSQTQASSSGTSDGERTGTGDPVNDYHQAYSFTIPVDNSPRINCSVTITKVADPAGPVTAGGQIGFTVTLTNSSPVTASGLAFTDNLPAGGSLNWSINLPSAGWSTSGTGGNQQLVYGPTTLAGNTSTSVHVVSSTTKRDCGTVTNTASFTTTNDGSGSAPASVTIINCTPPASPSPSPSPVDLAIAKTLLTPSLVIYSPASYQLLVTNVGPTDVPANTLITVTDQLDPGLTYTTVISSPATPVTWVCDSPPNGNLVHCIYSGGVGANQPLPAIIVTVNVLKGAGPITNCADVSVAANDNNLVNNHVCTIPNPVLGP